MFSFFKRIFSKESQGNLSESAVHAALSDSRFDWRSIEALTKASGLSADETRALIAKIGVNRSYGDKEVYTIHSHVGGYPFSFFVPAAANAIDRVKEALNDTRYKWRSIEALSKASGLGFEQTRSLLRSLPARKYQTANKELYTLSSASLD